MSALPIVEAGALQLLVVALAAFISSVIGGLSGQGTGLILPVFLAPVVGIANVVPVMSITALMTNLSRLAVFWRDIDFPRARRVLLGALPGALLGACVFTWLDTRWIGFALGGFLIISIPLRRLLQKARYTLEDAGLTAAGAAFGVLAGGMTGTGLVLLSILMAGGVHGSPLIASDAAVSSVVNLVKMAVFGSSSLLDARLVVAGVLIGLCTTPGAFVARWLMKKLSLRVHGYIMETVILCGGASLLWRAFQQ